MISQDELNQLLRYDPVSGELYWRHSRGRNPANMRAGGSHRTGYRVVTVCGRQFSEHQLIWYMMTGQLSTRSMPIDHINGVRDDNRWCNLRMVPRKLNSWNRRASCATGHLGVREQRGRYRAFIGCRHNYRGLGTYGTVEEAIAARKAAEVDRERSFKTALGDA
jgi:hypothetical protein